MKYRVMFIRHEIIVRDAYFHTSKDAEIYANMVKRKLKGMVLYLGTNYDNAIPFDYRVSVEIERTYKL